MPIMMSASNGDRDRRAAPNEFVPLQASHFGLMSKIIMSPEEEERGEGMGEHEFYDISSIAAATR